MAVYFLGCSCLALSPSLLTAILRSSKPISHPFRALVFVPRPLMMLLLRAITGFSTILKLTSRSGPVFPPFTPTPRMRSWSLKSQRCLGLLTPGSTETPSCRPKCWTLHST
ncbi:hypothetical protein LZ32DRAFT_153808 [Colletotrichum eremochloae]|nr:hypothetical protein LY78DRAFT_122827 [Colletotrichum sublineola]KAK2019863.1 hypothetical protein LZ32DRAFT_153808 [Colletotrichum eremochloae]